MAVLEVKKLVKSFRDGTQKTLVLKGIDFSIDQGEFVSITGASGTGKSTLVYLLGLLDVPTSGEVFVGGVAGPDLSLIHI